MVSLHSALKTSNCLSHIVIFSYARRLATCEDYAPGWCRLYSTCEFVSSLLYWWQTLFSTKFLKPPSFNTAAILLWVLAPNDRTIFKNILFMTIQVTSGVMTCRIILNLREYSKKEIVAYDGRSISIGMASSVGGDKVLHPAALVKQQTDKNDISSSVRSSNSRRFPRPALVPGPLPSMKGFGYEQSPSGMLFSPRDTSSITTTQSALMGFGVDECTTIGDGNDLESGYVDALSHESEEREYVYDHDLMRYEEFEQDYLESSSKERS